MGAKERAGGEEGGDGGFGGEERGGEGGAEREGERCVAAVCGSHEMVCSRVRWSTCLIAGQIFFKPVLIVYVDRARRAKDSSRRPPSFLSSVDAAAFDCYSCASFWFC